MRQLQSRPCALSSALVSIVARLVQRLQVHAFALDQLTAGADIQQIGFELITGGSLHLHSSHRYSCILQRLYQLTVPGKHSNVHLPAIVTAGRSAKPAKPLAQPSPNTLLQILCIPCSLHERCISCTLIRAPTCPGCFCATTLLQCMEHTLCLLIGRVQR